VIENLKRSATPNERVIYCFFEHARRSELTAEAVFADLILQVLQTGAASSLRDALFSKLGQLHLEAERGRRRPLLYELTDLFRFVCQNVDRITVIIDALDECEHRVRRSLTTGLNTVENTNLLVLITSRPHIQLRTHFDIGIIHDVDVHAHTADLRLFIEARIAENEDLERIVVSAPEGFSAVIAKIIAKAECRYVWRRGIYNLY